MKKPKTTQYRAVHLFPTPQGPCTYANANRGTNTNAMIFNSKLQLQVSNKTNVMHSTPLPQVLEHGPHDVLSRIGNVPILRPAAMLVSHKLLDLGIVMWALRWPRNLGLILWCRTVLSLTQDLAYSRYILGHLMREKISPFILHS